MADEKIRVRDVKDQLRAMGLRVQDYQEDLEVALGDIELRKKTPRLDPSDIRSLSVFQPYKEDRRDGIVYNPLTGVRYFITGVAEDCTRYMIHILDRKRK